MNQEGVSTIFSLQAETQLKAMYEKNAEKFVNACDTYLFLVSGDYYTLAFVSERFGIDAERLPDGDWHNRQCVVFQRDKKPEPMKTEKAISYI